MNPFPLILEGIEDLDSDHIRHILTRAQHFQSHYFNPLALPDEPENLKKYTVCTFFQEDSTRTKISFIRAAQNLGINHIPFDGQSSSLKKGESLEETLYTLKYLGINLVVYRTAKNHELEPFRMDPPMAIINAGDGTNQHPTQALTDLYTLYDCEKDIRHKTIAIIGDCKHSRVCNSLVDLLNKMHIKVLLVTPKGLDLSNFSQKNVEIIHDADEAIKRSDLLYLLRIQKERHRSDVDRELFKNYYDNFGISIERLQKIGKFPPIYHAGPAVSGIEIDYACLKSTYFRGHDQVRNGVFVRMALLESMIKATDYNYIHQWNLQHEKNLQESLLVL